MLQSNPTLEKIRKNLTKKILGELKKSMIESPESYTLFLENYGTILKEGMYYDKDLQPDVAEVVKWQSFQHKKAITFDEYITAHMPKSETVISDETQKETSTIYYITAKSKNEALASPYLAQFETAGVDVLILTDSIDDFIMQSFTEYKGAKLVSITSSDIELTKDTDEEKQHKETVKRDFKDFLELTKNTIGTDKLEKVELNDKLGSALGALKTTAGGMTPQMEKMYKAMGQALPPQKRILELNPHHEIVQQMKQTFATDLKSEDLKNMMWYAYEQAVLLEGGELEDIGGFIKRVNTFLKK
jgi:molecular chaperone HtpG